MDDNHGRPEIHREIVTLIDAGRSFALATILRADGSTPQKAGVKAIIDADGAIRGTLGGGFIEAETRRRAGDACRSRRPVVFDFQLDEAYARDAILICGGAMRILIDPTAAGHRTCYAKTVAALEQRSRSVLLTRVRTETQPKGQAVEVTVRWFPQDGLPSDADVSDAEVIRSCLDCHTPRLLVENSRDPLQRTEVFVEPVIPEPQLLIVGGGHVGQALAVQAVELGFDVIVIDDRPEFTAADLFPQGVTTRCGNVSEELAGSPLAEDSYVVIVNRGHLHDTAALGACIHSRAAYVGMIGSRRKVSLIRENFLQSGLATKEEFDRVFAPIGLDIGAVSVPEIATSIAAQLVAVRRKGRTSLRPDDMVLR